MDRCKNIGTDIEDIRQIRDKIYSVVVKERLKAGKQLFTGFKEAGIKYAVYKGAVLSYVLYGSPFIRRSGDTDILVSRADASKVKTMFLADGFVQGCIAENSDTHIYGIEKYKRTAAVYQASHSHQLASFVKETGNVFCRFVNYDVNIDIFWGESGRHIDMDSFLADTLETDICGIKLCKLRPEAEFIAMCMHHYKDMNSIYLLWERGINRTELDEVYLYIKKNIMDWEYLYNLCVKHGVSDYIYYCISKADLLYQDSILDELSKKFESKSGKALLNCFGLCDLERKYWNVDFMTILKAGDIKMYMRPFLAAEDYRKIELNKRMMESNMEGIKIG